MTSQIPAPPNPLEQLLGITAGSTTQAISGSAQQLTETGGHHPKPAPSFSMLDPTTGEMLERPTIDVTDAQHEKEDRTEDLFIDAQLQEVHEAAMAAFYAQHAASQGVDPKFSARNAEVAAQFLNTALATVNSRVEAKFKRQKVRLDKAKLGEAKGSINNNIIFADRNTLLKQLLSDPTLLPGDPN
jgi:hypothetical protein